MTTDQFPLSVMRFLQQLRDNNQTSWFAANRDKYQRELVAPVKAFMEYLEHWLGPLNEDLDLKYRVNTTVMPINRDRRFNPGGEPYRHYVKGSFPLKGFKWSTDPVFGFGVFPDYLYIAFRNAGPKRRSFVERFRANIRQHQEILQAWLDKEAADCGFHLLGGAHDDVKQQRFCPGLASDWLTLSEPTVGIVWSRDAIAKLRTPFASLVGRKLAGLYFLKLLAVSDDVPGESARFFRYLDHLSRKGSDPVGPSEDLVWSYEHSEETNAPAEAVWNLWRDVSVWPQWDKDLEWARLSGPFTSGSRGSLKPVGQRSAEFILTQVRKNKSFADQTDLAEGRLRFEHEITAVRPGRRHITHRVVIEGRNTEAYVKQFGDRLAQRLPAAVRTIKRLAETQAASPKRARLAAQV